MPSCEESSPPIPFDHLNSVEIALYENNSVSKRKIKKRKEKEYTHLDTNSIVLDGPKGNILVSAFTLTSSSPQEQQWRPCPQGSGTGPGRISWSGVPQC